MEANKANEQYLRQVKLDRGQRARAELISGEVNENPIMAAFELIYLRDQNNELARLLRYAATYSSLAPLMNDSWREDSLAALDVPKEKGSV